MKTGTWELCLLQCCFPTQRWSGGWGQAWRMVHPQEDGVGEGGWEVGLKITGGGWQPWVCDSYLGTCVATDSVQVSQV